MIEFDNDLPFGGDADMVKKITRPRAIKILALITEAREVIIQTHPEPETVRHCYNSDWIMSMCEKDPEVIDPRGTLRFLHKIDALFAELGLSDAPEEDDAATRASEDMARGESNIPPANENDPDGF